MLDSTNFLLAQERVGQFHLILLLYCSPQPKCHVSVGFQNPGIGFSVGTMDCGENRATGNHF